MLPPATERPKLRTVLGQLSAAVEELLLSGLTTASEATRQMMMRAMEEAARFRLLRLGGTLRVAAEELGRFTQHDPAFSRRRLTFFLNRSWVMSRGLAHALETGDEREYDRLNWSPTTQPLPSAEVVTLGVVKRVTSAAVIFEFRLRAVAGSAPITVGQRLMWSFVFPVKPGDADFPPEGHLYTTGKHAPFRPLNLLERKVIGLENASVALDEPGLGRLSLTDRSTVTVGQPFADWSRFLDWSSDAAVERIGRHKPGPLDIDTELQEEVVLRDFEIAPPVGGDEPGQTASPITTGAFNLHGIIGSAAEGKDLEKGLAELRKMKRDRPPLFGLMHYERCRLVLQPLTAFGPDGPDYLTISKEPLNKAALLKRIKFT
jgi:hypothetical protein